MLDTREPFDPADPFNAMTESFRIAFVDAVVEADKAAIYRDMTAEDQIKSFILGGLTGVIGCAFASIQDDGRDEMIAYIAECVPVAAEAAAEIMENGSHA